MENINYTELLRNLLEEYKTVNNIGKYINLEIKLNNMLTDLIESNSHLLKSKNFVELIFLVVHASNYAYYTRLYEQFKNSQIIANLGADTMTLRNNKRKNVDLLQAIYSDNKDDEFKETLKEYIAVISEVNTDCQVKMHTK